jgi:hypothetical protein
MTQEDDFFSTGDARRCPNHPHIKTSSDDGLYDTPCGACEVAMEEAYREVEMSPFTAAMHFMENLMKGVVEALDHYDWFKGDETSCMTLNTDNIPF